LPDFMESITVTDLRINGATISFRAEKQHDSVAIQVLEKKGELNVIVKL
jgi:hypothetical protein